MGTRSETEQSPGDIDPVGPVDTIRLRGPSLVVVAFGLGLLTVTAWNFLREQRTLTVDVAPLAAAGLGIALSTGLLYAGVRLARSEFDRDERWRVTRVTLAGGAVFTGVILLTMLIRAAEGRAISEAPFVLFTAAGGGGIAGAMVGTLYARARRDARVAEYARAQAEQARERAENAREEAEEKGRQLEAARAETEQLLEAARQTRDDLQLINRVLRHDLKNSVMIIESRAEFLRDDLEEARDGSDDRAVEFLETIIAQAEEIEQEVERTGAVIETITDEDPDLAATDLGAAVRAQVDTLRGSFDVEVRIDGLDEGTDGPYVLANELLSDVFGNVLTNAVVHHDGDDPTVEVTVTADEETVTVRMADDGPGIPAEMRERVFHRGESSGEGGFGLFFVDRMLEQYGGSIRVEDAELGGTAFVFEFRRA